MGPRLDSSFEQSSLLLSKLKHVPKPSIQGSPFPRLNHHMLKCPDLSAQDTSSHREKHRGPQQEPNFGPPSVLRPCWNNESYCFTLISICMSISSQLVRTWNALLCPGAGYVAPEEFSRVKQLRVTPQSQTDVRHHQVKIIK